MRFNVDKCKVMVLNAPTKELTFMLSGKNLEIVKKMKYLGIILASSRLTSLYGKHIAIVVERAETKANLIKHMGFHKDGLRSETAIRMYKTLVRPILEYGAQVLSYKKYYFTERKPEKLEETSDYVKKLEKFQTKIIKKLIPCPKNTPPEILRLLTGVMPIQGG